jgi:hypothetical protein
LPEGEFPYSKNFLTIPKMYPIQINISKERLFPFAVLDTYDLCMENGHDNPKHTIISVSNKLEIMIKFIYPLPSLH